MPLVLSLLAALYAGMALSQLGLGEALHAFVFSAFAFIFAILAMAFVILRLRDRLAAKQRGGFVVMDDDVTRDWPLMHRRAQRLLRSEQITQTFRK